MSKLFSCDSMIYVGPNMLKVSVIQLSSLVVCKFTFTVESRKLGT